ncbi:MAG: hypothetical protein ACPG3W_05300 [Synechococcus sp.]|uniref:hypothetical protein n=1 Tax=Synechococcus sp. BMK-MC-1 TaxID=1442551 RepID=UPI001CA431D3
MATSSSNAQAPTNSTTHPGSHCNGQSQRIPHTTRATQQTLKQRSRCRRPGRGVRGSAPIHCLPLGTEWQQLREPV